MNEGEDERSSADFVFKCSDRLPDALSQSFQISPKALQVPQAFGL